VKTPYVDSAGVQIYFEVVSSGFPVVLHTGGGGDGTMWEQGGYVEGLNAFRCILIDHRGHGRSDKPGRVENHLMERYVADVIAVLDTLGIERAAFWGYSAGSSVGYALAATHPERVAAVIASGAIGPRDYDQPDERRDAERSANLSRQHGLGHLIKELEEAEGMSFPQWFRRQMTNTDGKMFALEVLGAAEWQGPWTLLPRIKTPVLMLVGELEDPEGDNPRAASILPNARCVTFAAVGHVGVFLRSELALAQAVPFLQAVSELDNAV
jgi:pimeloyl-ACP methyl ester carboxylesterase